MVAILQLPRTVSGAGALAQLGAELAGLGVSRPLLVTDQGLQRAGVVARVLAVMGQPAAMFDQVTENPLFADVAAGAALYAQNGCDGVVALGGGSVIDTAKYIALLATNPGSVADYAGVPGAAKVRAAPLIVLPTTAGTGSESSPDAGIHPDAGLASVGMSSPLITPHVAILDPVLTLTLPPYLTAATGIDAISHCIEGYLSSGGSSFLDQVALEGVRRAMGAVRRVTADGQDLAAREDMMAAAFAGGVAIGMGLGPAHAIAISCGDQGFHHGVLSGIGLVCTLDFILEQVPDRAAPLREALGIAAGVSPADAIAALMNDLALPATLAQLGYRARDTAALAQASHGSPFNMSSRVHPSAVQYQAMIERSLAGAAG